MTSPVPQTSGDVEKLRAIAEKAAAVSGDEWLVSPPAYGLHEVVQNPYSVSVAESVIADHAEHIAAFDPPTVLRLLAELAEARGERDAANGALFLVKHRLALARKGLEEIAVNDDGGKNFRATLWGVRRIARETLLALSGGKKDV